MEVHKAVVFDLYFTITSWVMCCYIFCDRIYTISITENEMPCVWVCVCLQSEKVVIICLHVHAIWLICMAFRKDYRHISIFLR
jgi:hypothetical protein